MMTNACVNVLQKNDSGVGEGWGVGAAPGVAKPGRKMEHLLSSAALIWQCEVSNDEKEMNMIKKG